MSVDPWQGAGSAWPPVLARRGCWPGRSAWPWPSRLWWPASGFDTDLLGAFSGERPRPAEARETCRRMAEAGMDLMGLDMGLASEGSFGPHPACPWLAAGFEWLTFVDRRAHQFRSSGGVARRRHRGLAGASGVPFPCPDRPSPPGRELRGRSVDQRNPGCRDVAGCAGALCRCIRRWVGLAGNRHAGPLQPHTPGAWLKGWLACPALRLVWSAHKESPCRGVDASPATTGRRSPGRTDGHGPIRAIAHGVLPMV